MPKLFPILALLLLAAAPGALAQTSLAVGGEFQVNSYTTNSQGDSSVAVDADGDFVVVWTSDGSDNGDPFAQSIQGQRYASNGDPLGAQFLVNSYTTSNQLWPALAMDADGDFVVVWTSLGSDNGDPSDSIQGQRYASNGDPLGAQFLVNSFTTDSQLFPAVAVDPDGDFVVSWEHGGGLAYPSVHARRFASDGNPLGGQFRANSYTTIIVRDSSVAVDADGDFVVVWTSGGFYSGDLSPPSIQGRRYASDGDPLGVQFQVNSYTTSTQRFAAVAADADGDFVIVWQSDGSDSGDTLSYSIQGQRYASDGDPLGAQFQVNSYTTGSQSGSSVAVDPDGNFVVVWRSEGSDNGDTSSSSVQGRLYAADGDPVGLQFLVNSYTMGSQGGPSVAVDSDSVFVVVWGANGSGYGDTSSSSVQGQRFHFPPSVGDRVWRDVNANGVQDGGEPGVSGVTVILHDVLGAVIDQTETDADGAYNLWAEAGDYYIEFVAPEGDDFTFRDVGLDDTIDSDAAQDGVTIVFSIDTAGSDTSRDAGLVAATALVGDRVWLDADANGVQNGGENGVSGVSVNLYREPDPPFVTVKAATLAATGVTDPDGYYSFSVDPGKYYLEFVCSTASFTALDQGNADDVDSDVEPSLGTTSPFVLEGGAADGTRDAGLLDPDGDGVACSDNCPADDNAGQEDGDGDGLGDVCDLCAGDNATGDGDGDGVCADLDCDDGDPSNVCLVFSDGFELGDTSAWSSSVP